MNYTDNTATTQTFRVLRLEALEITQHVEKQPAPTLELNEDDFNINEYLARPKVLKFWSQKQVNPSQVGKIIAARKPEAFNGWSQQWCH
jgi:hypothetical protein